ncbi:murein hydrolase activator EnvC family protein [Rhodoplanes sp. Z2-YC6860]|uniref:murein hydrolase activator EnvC family protein n=1 Tax=Rhodoplanes sp. Z2-YC6860 TaxID=674703 RepID=UPI00078EF180|nr:peptidoglycan DD-metalloendopeptidase family protein [Rhodoplanes sp. Z2-YC6860]AMN38996.1 peptidase M23B [Rhodoplanes sp. Z2-YC6860]
MSASERPTDSSRAPAALLAVALLLAPFPSALAQSTLDSLHQREQELEAIRNEQKKAAETEARLKGEIESIGADRAKLNQALIDAAARSRAAEDRIAETEARLKPLDTTEQRLRESLSSRRATIVEVLAALQRVGRHPPPAIMVRPEDALQTVRTAIMLGAVLPEMRAQADQLVADLSDLVRIRKEIGEEKERLARDAGALNEERQRLSLLIDERQKKQADTEKALDTERQKSVALARQVDNLKDLIGKVEQSLEAANRAAREAEQAAKEQAKEQAKETARTGDRTDLAALRDPGRLAPAVAFPSARGQLPLPVNGVRIKEFGAPDSAGGTEKGILLATRAGSQVTAPCDGWVVYAAPFRNYGQVLILNAGGGYHVVLAGMDRISVNVGQFVLTGEPVAVMGGSAQTPVTSASNSNKPTLYVEFRKDGTPIDPNPWWAASKGEKVRG